MYIYVCKKLEIGNSKYICPVSYTVSYYCRSPGLPEVCLVWRYINRYDAG